MKLASSPRSARPSSRLISIYLDFKILNIYFKAKEAEILGGRNELEASILTETEQKLAEMNQRVAQQEQAVIDQLVQQVC